ncbi:hypothetical protein Tco_0290866 [Tanacetum coccineum]
MRVYPLSHVSIHVDATLAHVADTWIHVACHVATRPTIDPTVDWRSTTVDWWLTGGPVVVVAVRGSVRGTVAVGGTSFNLRVEMRRVWELGLMTWIDQGKGLKINDEYDEDKDGIKGLIWVNDHIANKRRKDWASVIMGLFMKKMFGVCVEEMKSLVG